MLYNIYGLIVLATSMSGKFKVLIKNNNFHRAGFFGPCCLGEVNLILESS